MTFIFSLAKTFEHVAQQAGAVGGLDQHIHRVHAAPLAERSAGESAQATAITRSGARAISRRLLQSARWMAHPCRASRSRRWRRAARGGSSARAWSSANRCPPPAPHRGLRCWLSGCDAGQQFVFVGRGLRAGAAAARCCAANSSCRPPQTTPRHPEAQACGQVVVLDGRLASRCSRLRPGPGLGDGVACCRALNQARTLALERWLFRKPSSGLSQSSDGPPSLAARISTVCAALQRVLSGTICPSTARRGSGGRGRCARRRRSRSAWRPAGSSTMAACGVKT